MGAYSLLKHSIFSLLIFYSGLVSLLPPPNTASSLSSPISRSLRHTLKPVQPPPRPTPRPKMSPRPKPARLILSLHLLSTILMALASGTRTW